MTLQDLTPIFHTIDADIWEVAKYLIFCFLGVIIWLAKRMVDSNERLADSVKDLRTDITIMKNNSDSTNEQLKNISGELKDVNHILTTHEQRLLHIERKIKIS